MSRFYRANGAQPEARAKAKFGVHEGFKNPSLSP